jgi:hypothetical protein
MTTFTSDFSPRDLVIIDGQADMPATVTGFLFRDGMRQIECEWLHNGQNQSAWFAPWRLTRV